MAINWYFPIYLIAHLIVCTFVNHVQIEKFKNFLSVISKYIFKFHSNNKYIIYPNILIKTIINVSIDLKNLTHIRPMSHLRINQVVGFY